jgi:hypothetical protein
MYAIRRHDDDPARGYGAFCSRRIASGETVLHEVPILVYPQASLADQVCSHCLKDLGRPDGEAGGPSDAEGRRGARAANCCSACGGASFCGETCRVAAEADPGSHSPLACAIMRSVCVSEATDETVSALHLLSRVYSLLVAGRLGDAGALQRYEGFLSLSDGNKDLILQDKDYEVWLDDVNSRFAPCLARLEEGSLLPGLGPARLPEATPDFVKSVCLKDLVNAYGIRAPLRLGSDCGMLRGTALYREASRINHECLPNVARCEDFDQSPAMKFVALHDLPEGEEITQSYFPLNWDAEDRQTRCRTVYGFHCRCPRCVLEAGDGPGDVSEESTGIDDGYVSVFLLKYLCVDEDCEGTMVPALGDADKTQTCNVCGKSRTEAQFLDSISAQ